MSQKISALLGLGVIGLVLLIRHLKPKRPRPTRGGETKILATARPPVFPPKPFNPSGPKKEVNKLWMLELKRLGVQVDYVTPFPIKALVVTYRGRQTVWSAKLSLNPKQSGLVSKICDSKILAYYLLAHFGFPVPETLVLARPMENVEEDAVCGLDGVIYGPTAEDLISRAVPVIKKKFSFPEKCVVVKPNGEFGGRGVLANLGFGKGQERDKKSYEHMESVLVEALQGAFKEAKRDPIVLVQEHVPGRNYRVMVLECEIIAVSERILPAVVGDGKSSIQALIDHANVLRGGHKPLTVNQDLHHVLQTQGLTLESVPKKDELIVIHSTHSLSVGATTRDYTEEIHPTFTKMIQDMTKTFNIFFIGLDMHCEDITKPLDSQSCHIIELNAAPGWLMHYTPVHGEPRNIGRALMGAMIPELRKDPLFWQDGGPAPGRMSRELCAQYLHDLDHWDSVELGAAGSSYSS